LAASRAILSYLSIASYLLSLYQSRVPNPVRSVRLPKQPSDKGKYSHGARRHRAALLAQWEHQPEHQDRALLGTSRAHQPDAMHSSGEESPPYHLTDDVEAGAVEPPRPGSSLRLNRSGSSSESERRPAPRGQTRSTRDASDSESELHHQRQHHHTPPSGPRHSTKEKRGKHRKYESPTSRLLRCIAMSGLACTLCALGVLLLRSPAQHAELAGSPLVTGSRVLHLTLVGSERKARFGVSPSLTWAEFLQGG